jgi:hypothetical protein
MESTPVPVTTVARHLAMGLGCQNFTCGGYGTVDEANAIIGIALLRIADANVRDALTRIQNDLFDLGADLCRPEPGAGTSKGGTAAGQRAASDLGGRNDRLDGTGGRS